jgi:hypothetical protein
MPWSRLKKQVESRFAATMVGRVELRATSYRHTHDEEGRGWITLDKEEVHNFCTIRFWIEQGTLLQGIRAANSATDFHDPAQRAEYYHAYEQADEILEERGVRSKEWFENSLKEYLSMTLEESLASKNFLHRALAVLDRRLGKRRLKTLELSSGEHALVSRFLEFRRAVEFPVRVEGGQPLVPAEAPAAGIEPGVETHMITHK